MKNIILARSENYIITHEFEIASLIRIRDNFQVIIGDFYGDPSCAFISEDERFCIVGGYGFIIYYIQEPFIPYEYDKKTKQWIEFYRDKDNTLWIENIYKSNLND